MKNDTIEFQVSFLMFLCFLKKYSVNYKSSCAKELCKLEITLQMLAIIATAMLSV